MATLPIQYCIDLYLYNYPRLNLSHILFQSFLIYDHCAVTFELLLPTFAIPRPLVHLERYMLLIYIILLDTFVLNLISISVISYLTLSL